MSRRVRLLSAVIAGGFLFGACSNDLSAQLEAADALVVEFELTQVTGPSEVDSVTVFYITVSGLMEGDQKSVVESVQGRLTDAGWSVVLVEPIDVSGSPTSEGDRLVATKDGLAVQVAIFDKVGVNPATPGFREVQVAVARSGDPLEWAHIG